MNIVTGNNQNVRVYNDKQELVDSFTEEFINAVNLQVNSSESFFLALSGGNTPRLIYQKFSKVENKQLWEKINLFWGDERFVPPENPESNYKMAFDAFISKVPIPQKQIYRIYGEGAPEKERVRYEEEIKKNVPLSENGIPRFDWIFLGLGTDGHIASLFPDTINFSNMNSLCIITEHPFTGQKRLSFTLPLINNAKRISFIVTGEEKANVVNQILSGSPHCLKYPAAHVKPNDGLIEWFLDSTVF